MFYLFLILIKSSLFEQFCNNFTPILCKSERFSNLNYNFLIEKCEFISIYSTNQNGGVIYLNSILIKIGIEKSYFFHCHTYPNYDGGALFIISLDFIINKVYFSNCYTLGDNLYMFFYSKVENNHYQILKEISIHNGIHNGNSNGHTIFLENGFLNVSTYNSSFSNVFMSSGILCRSYNNMNLNFLTITNNIDRSYPCLIFSWYTSSCKINYSNIINNNCGNGIWAQTFLVDQLITTIENIIFYKNKNSQIFRLASGSLTLINCKSDQYSISGLPLITSNFILQTNTYIETLIISNYILNNNNINQNSCIINFHSKFFFNYFSIFYFFFYILN